LAGRTSNDLGHIRSLVRDVCVLETEPDGMEFDAAFLEASRVKEDADYEGVRVRFQATLARARIPMQIDISFGDVIVPRPTVIEYPTLLEFPPPILAAYPRETVVAEKLEALTILGLLNSRLKDYYDLWLLSRLYPFDGALLVEAIRATFQHRGTVVEPLPVGLAPAFSAEPAKPVQWRAFLRRSRLVEEPVALVELVTAVRRFSSPPLSAAAANAPFHSTWRPGRPWT